MPRPSPPLSSTPPATRGSRWRALGLLLALLASGCGKRGAPLPPLPRMPAAVQTFTAARRGETVDITLQVPTANAGGDQPADIGRVEVYALTAAAPPTLVTGRVPDGASLVAASPVRRPAPPPPPSPAPSTPLPQTPGVNQGEAASFLETLTPQALRPVERVVAARPEEGPALSVPVVFEPADQHLKRHYFAAAVSRRGRFGGWSPVRSVPVAAPSGAPSAPVVTFDATGYALTWTPAPDAREAPVAAADTLEFRALGATRPPTRYNVYASDPAGAAAATPLNPDPLAAVATGAPGIAFDQEKCFVVRGVDTFDGVAVEGPASPPGCVTARDTFPPAAPTALEAVGGAGVISLIWEGVEAPDLAGYLVLRGEAGAEPTTVLTPAPIAARSFEDRQVTPGTRYVYVVVAVDSATPPNRSVPSNRAEETARR